MTVKQGYKLTEVGVIPEDWEIKPVFSFSTVKTGPFGSALHEEDYVAIGTPIITVEHLGERGVEHRNLPLVSDFDKHRLKSYILKEGDIVFSRVGSVDRNAIITQKEDGWLFSGRLLRVRPNTNNNPKFISFHFHTASFKKRVKSVAVGQTMASINTQILKSVLAFFPPTLAEQTAIANALSDADAYINSLELLIAKKQQIKQGTMQELLTGKKRLEGFSGEWEEKKLGDICVYKNGKSYEDLIIPTGDYLLITLNSIDINGNLKKEHLKIGKYDNSLKKNDLIMILSDVAHGNFLGLTAIIPENNKYVLNQRVGALEVSSTVNSYFLSSHINYYQEYFKKSGKGSSQQNLGKDDILKFPVKLPPLPEQTAIANILTNMDNEIQELQNKLTKAKHIKQGMMQELLTGKTRLI